MAREEGQISGDDDARDGRDRGATQRKVGRLRERGKGNGERARENEGRASEGARENRRERGTNAADVGAVFAKQGRGYDRARDDGEREYARGEYELVGGDDDGGNAAGANDPVRSVEGWIVVVDGVHEEAQEDDVHDAFADFGDILNLHLNLDRRTGFVKGYAFIEYAEKKEAQAAIDAMHGADFLGKKLSVAWAFVRGSRGAASRRR